MTDVDFLTHLETTAQARRSIWISAADTQRLLCLAAVNRSNRRHRGRARQLPSSEVLNAVEMARARIANAVAGYLVGTP